MWPFNRKKPEEQRAESTGTVSFEDSLLQAMLGQTSVTKAVAMQIPTVSGAIGVIADTIAGTPIKLYKDEGGKAQEVKGDPRIALLNDDTKDTLSANEFWRAILRDYYLGKGGYAYINKQRGQFKSLHHTNEMHVTVQKNADPVFKDYDILVYGKMYKPFDFLKILRNSNDGASGTGIITENSQVLEVAYEALKFESALVKKGGNKKGFLKAPKKLTNDAMSALKTAFRNLYSNNDESVVVLNEGLEFQESSNTSVEMQLNENKVTNSQEIGKIFRVSPGVIAGNATEQEMSSFIKLCILPLMKTIQCSLNRDFLLEKEKGSFYWAFDTKELLKGSMKDRYEAYKAGIDANVLQVDEARYMEDMPALGFNYIKLGLDSVLYDPKTKTVYTPNTGQTQDMKEQKHDKGGEITENQI